VESGVKIRRKIIEIPGKEEGLILDVACQFGISISAKSLIAGTASS
jgi:hypothetical protein